MLLMYLEIRFLRWIGCWSARWVDCANCRLAYHPVIRKTKKGQQSDLLSHS
jgi:hypothetical protein